jgi:hypothetical protein
MGLEGIVSKRIGSRYRSGRSKDWLKFKNPEASAVKREAEEDWTRWSMTVKFELKHELPTAEVGLDPSGGGYIGSGCHRCRSLDSGNRFCEPQDGRSSSTSQSRPPTSSSYRLGLVLENVLHPLSF